MSVVDRFIYIDLVIMWLCAEEFFWSWWLRSSHVVTAAGMVVNSMLFVWSLVMPGVFLIHLGRMARPNPRLPVPKLRVAIIVTKAPGEPWAVVRGTLRAMLRQEMPYPFGVWLADEAPAPETLRWCDANGVRVSTRRERPDYHRDTWPRRTKCKEGNLAFFYDHWGYRDYDVVAQLDADHRPSPTYLREMVRPFIDPEVGYVAAPSICDANAQGCWAARGRLYKEAGWHGPQQAGSHHLVPPVCIGSHYAVRTAALAEIGGIGPELAEDFSTSLMMNSFGWRGVFALDAEAHGDGPETFADFVTQEFQWARSLSDITLRYNRFYFHRLARLAKVKLGYGEAWYPLHASYMLAACLLPIVALLTGTPWANVTLPDFFAHVLVVSSVVFLAAIWARSKGWFRPARVPLFSWELLLFTFTRWPWIVWGVAQSWAGWILRRRFGFKVTPKGVEDVPPLALKAVAPYLMISGGSALTALLVAHPGAAQGYFYFCLLNAVVYLAVTAAVIALHLREAGALSWKGASRFAAGPTLAAAFTATPVLASVINRGGLAADAILPQSVWRQVEAALRNVFLRFHAGGEVALTTWLLLGTGTLLVLASVSHASRHHVGRRSRRANHPRPLAHSLLFALAGCAGIAFAISAAGASASAADATGLVLGVIALGASILAGRYERKAELALPPGNTSLSGKAPPLIPRSAVAANSTGLAQLRPPAIAAVAPASVPREVAIVWGTDESLGGFHVRPTDPDSDMRLPYRLLVAGAGGSRPPDRTFEASRAHAILYDLLVSGGWELCGRGEHWYAHRFRPAGASPRAARALAAG
jgi:cellulose synthase/poly-beta-1,6-N-acetylglucosamine synthase-like glycosyltransferase